MMFPACKRTLSSAPRILLVLRRTLSMRQKQEHLYSTLLIAGEVLVEKHGPPDVTTAVVEALRLQWAYGFPYTPQDLPLLTHGFGIYPAGMQPAAASHLLKTILPGKTVFDPFLGGGTVVLEALRAGRLGIGSDISPLALFVARGRTWTASNIELEELREASRSICTAAATRLEAQGGQISGRDWEVFKAEMGNFLSKKQVVSNAVRDGLWFLFTVAVQKATKARRRSSQRSRERNVVAHHFFERVCGEYTRAVERLTTAAIQTAPSSEPQKPLIFRNDARRPLASVMGEAAGRLHGGLVDAVLTSPPYPGVYDYLSHARQARSNLGRLSESSRGGLASFEFLDVELPAGRNWTSAWTDGEVGSKAVARRRRRRSEEAFRDEMSKETAWENDQREWLCATTSALRAGGRLGIMIGDGDGIDTRSSLLRTVDMLREEGKAGAVGVIGWATLRAAADATRRMRTEHIIVLEKDK